MTLFLQGADYADFTRIQFLFLKSAFILRHPRLMA